MNEILFLVLSWAIFVACVLIIRNDQEKAFETRWMTPFAFVFCVVFGLFALGGTCFLFAELLGV